MEYKYVIAGLLCLSMALALDVTSPQPVLSVNQGEVADFTVVLVGTAEDVQLTMDSDIPAIPSRSNFYIDGLEEIHIFVITDDVPTGAYIVTLHAQGATETVHYLLGVEVTEGTPYVSFNTIYSKVDVVQGEETELRFLITNKDTQPVRNIVIKGDVLGGMNPKYPAVFDLDIDESREVTVDLDVTRDFPPGRHYFTVVAAIGNAEYTADVTVEVEEKPPLDEVLDVDVSNSWDPLKRGDDVIGYKLYVTVENDGKFDAENLQLYLQPLPEEQLPDDWEVFGDTEFDLDAYEEKELVIEIETNDFGEHTVNLVLAQDFNTIYEEEVEFAGHKVGAPTGAFVYGGSLTIGLLFVVIIVVVFLYIRQRSRLSEKAETTQSKAYLKKLVDQAKEEESTNGKKGARK